MFYLKWIFVFIFIVIELFVYAFNASWEYEAWFLRPWQHASKSCWRWMVMLACNPMKKERERILSHLIKWTITTFYLWPIVADCISENTTISIECCAHNLSICLGERLQTLLWILIPETDCAISTSCWKGAMNRVETDIINGIYIFGIITVTFKREILTIVVVVSMSGMNAKTIYSYSNLRWIFIFDILNTNSSFNWTDSKTFTVRETWYYTSLPFQRWCQVLINFI